MEGNRHFYVASIAFMLFVELTSLGRAVWRVPPEAFDFRQLYSAGAMVRAGDGTKLYDAERLHAYEDRLVSPRGGVLPFNHPAYETLSYLPLTLLSYRSAYYAMTIVNLILLIGLALALRPQIRALSETWVWLPTTIFLSFLPFAITVIQGQDSILLALCIALAGLMLDRHREKEAGLFLALGLFKFQFVLPIVLLMLVWRKWKVMGGFAAGAAIVGGISLSITGARAVSQYVSSLLSMSNMSQGAEDVYGIHPAVMPNLRGLVYYLPHATAWTVVLSLLLLGWAATRKYSFDLAVLVAVLVSYHCLYHDLSILAVPLIRMTTKQQKVAGMFLVPSVAYGFGLPFWLISVPILRLAAYESKELKGWAIWLALFCLTLFVGFWAALHGK